MGTTLPDFYWESEVRLYAQVDLKLSDTSAPFHNYSSYRWAPPCLAFWVLGDVGGGGGVVNMALLLVQADLELIH